MADQKKLVEALRGSDDDIFSKALPMEGRLTFLPARVTPQGKEWAVPGVLASAWNAFTAPSRALRGQLDNPMEEALNVAGMAMTGAMPFSAPKGSLGMNVWHGSPHKFDKFDAKKIGTGEGAQAYGHGMYLAEAADVAKQYQKTLAADGFLVGDKVFDPSTLKHLNVRAVARKGNLDAAIQKAKSIASGNSSAASLAADDLQALNGIKAAGGMKPNTGSLYKVDLPDEQIAKMLDWDKPLSQQAPEVRKALTSIARQDEEVMRMFRELGPSAPANQAYAALTQQAVRRKKYEGMRAGIPEAQALPNLAYGQDIASRQLREMGIPGIRYLDGGSRGVGEGTSNFVVFPGNENLLTILERNGQPVVSEALVEALRKKK